MSSFFAARLADAFAIIVAYGPHAYFREGLHITDWKHGLLSNVAQAFLPVRFFTTQPKSKRSAWCTKAELNGNVDSENDHGGSSRDTCTTSD